MHRAFSMPGWERYSTWGMDLAGTYYAQLYRNKDDPDARPVIWLGASGPVLRSFDELVQAVTQAIAPFEPVPPPEALIRHAMLNG